MERGGDDGYFLYRQILITAWDDYFSTKERIMQGSFLSYDDIHHLIASYHLFTAYTPEHFRHLSLLCYGAHRDVDILVKKFKEKSDNDNFYDKIKKEDLLLLNTVYSKYVLYKQKANLYKKKISVLEGIGERTERQNIFLEKYRGKVDKFLKNREIIKEKKNLLLLKINKDLKGESNV